MGTKATQRKILSTLHPSTLLKPNLDPNTHPNPQPSPSPTPTPTPSPKPRPSPIKTEYWDRAGGGRNIRGKQLEGDGFSVPKFTSSAGLPPPSPYAISSTAQIEKKNNALPATTPPLARATPKSQN